LCPNFPCLLRADRNKRHEHKTDLRTSKLTPLIFAEINLPDKRLEETERKFYAKLICLVYTYGMPEVSAVPAD